MQHVYKCYEGTKRINPKANLPFIVIVAQTDQINAFSEHHVLTGLEELPYLHSSTGYEPGRSVAIEDFARLLTLDTILASQLDQAKANLENAIFELDKNLHQKAFWEGQNFEYRETDDRGFTRLAMDRKNKKIISEMLDTTQSEALDGLKKTWTILSQINIKAD
jgi:hypothetical protein